MLKKEIKKFDILSLAVGAIIGTGAFVLPGSMFLSAGMLNSIIAILIGGVIIVGVEKNYGYLLKKFPVAGGEYAFTYDAFGWKHALVCGWFLTLAYVSLIPFNATGLAFVAKFVMPSLLKVGYLYTIAGSSIYLGEVALAIFALCLFAWINIKGIKLASNFQNIMVLMLVGIVFLFLSLIIAKTGLDNPFTATFLDGQNIELSNILRVLAIAPMLYVGFDCIPQVAEELDFDAKEASRLAIFSIFIGAMIYCSILFFTSFGVTLEEITSGKIAWATGHTVEYYFGKIGLWALVLALLSAIVGGINGFYMAASRLLFAMSRGKILPEFFGVLDSKYQTPKNAILFILGISLIAPWFGRNVLGWIVGTSSVGASVGYLYASLSAYKLYKAEHSKVFLPAVFGSIASMMFLVLLLVPGLSSTLSMPSAIIVLLWAVMGYCFYRFYDLQVVHHTKQELNRLILNQGAVSIGK
ncbi:APC family permease [Pelagibaculum spongiae]|uniref:Amino acid permease n=1 Tax=Pelagibaculum spongiae TaxID=2080658 RepID=A0A2V1H0P1_9GAMM|nr:APC family permease [Pelagibaculum spongiae]PVZ71530.1 amino acid permease [Pelagibaculum spongiae]